MGLESLSRGADSCVFLEGDVKVHKALRDNVQNIAPEKETVCWKTNIHRTSFRPQGADKCLPYSLIFFDPPYAQCRMLAPQDVLGKCLNRLAKPGVSAPDALLILRTPEHFDFSESEAWRIDDCWRISTMNLWLLRPADAVSSASVPETSTASDSEKDESS